MQTETEERIRVFYREAFARRKALVGGFIVISLAMLLVGMNWPQTYSSSTTILVENQNIIEPLTRAAGMNSAADRAHNARELLFSRRMMMRVLEHGGYLEDDPTPREIEWMIQGLQGSTVVSAAGSNLVRITHQNEDPEQAYRNTKKLGELYIEAMRGAQYQESNTAYAFYDSQVERARQEVEATRARIEQLRTERPEARPGARERLDERLATLQSRVDAVESDLRQARTIEQSILEQLSGEVEGIESARAQQLRQRMIELEDQLDTLRLRYHDSYPDVVTLRAQIDELRGTLARVENESHGPDSEALRNSTLYQDLRSRLHDTRTSIRSLSVTLETEQERLAAARRQEAQIADAERIMLALVRDHEVATSIYEDLNRRREDARVGMNLSAQEQGLNIQVYEEPYIAHSPEGPRTRDFVMGGFALGAVVPLAMLFGFLMVDPRVRSGHGLSETVDIKLLGSVPHMATLTEARSERRGLVWAILVVLLTVVAIVGFLLLR